MQHERIALRHDEQVTRRHLDCASPRTLETNLPCAEFSKNLRRLSFLGASLLAIIVGEPVMATEGGGTSKALGVDTVLSGVMPPPGLRLTTFVAYYDADHTLDSSGNDRAGISNFNVHASAVTPRLQYVWSGVELWGANIETRFGFSAYVDAHVSFDLQTPGGKIHREGSSTGIGDMLIGPALLGWHSERFHQTAGVEFFLPTGKFDKTQLANTSRGYYSVGPAYLFTWFPTDVIEVSGSLIYLINRKNHDTNYRSGDEVSFDYGLGYALTPAWQIGANGYLYKQVTDDKQNGQVFGDGNRGQVLAIGPFVRYHLSPDWGITLKWQHEGQVENKTRGNRFFLQFALKLF
jgi:hypothetical protein